MLRGTTAEEKLPGSSVMSSSVEVLFYASSEIDSIKCEYKAHLVKPRAHAIGNAGARPLRLESQLRIALGGST